MENNLRTILLMAVLTVIFVWVGGQIGGRSGMVMAFLVSGAINFFAYWFSDKMVLRHYRAQVAEPGSRLYRIVAEQAQRAQLPMPKVSIIPEQSPNAFATGRNPQHAAVAATAGIVNLLDDSELAGVMAHELAHVKHRDILTGTIVATMAGALTMLSHMARYGAVSRDAERRRNPLGMILIMIGAPLAAMIIRAMISRTREYAADAGGASISNQPLGLASALKKISQTVSHVPLSQGNAAHAHMFIVNPFSGGLNRLFATHPPVEERIRRLQAMATAGQSN